MRSLFLITVCSSKDFYVVAESYAQAHDLFSKMIESLRESKDYYKIKSIRHITEEIYFFPDKEAVLYTEKTLILPDTKPKEKN